MIKIRTVFSILFSIVILCIFLILMTCLGLFQNRKEFGKSQFSRSQGISISDQIRERNEELTHCCLNYIITGDSIWAMSYEQFIKSSAYRFPSSRNGFNILEDSIRTLGFGDKEVELLKKAVQLAIYLNQKEAEAFDVYSLKMDDTARIIQREAALSIISSDEYLVAKKNMIRHISDFEARIEVKTDEIWQNNIDEGFRLFRMIIVALVMVIVFACIAFIMIFQRLRKEEKQDVIFRKGVEELKLTQKELLRSEERFELAVEGSGARIWDYNIADDNMIWAPQHLNLLGYEPGEVNGDMSYLLDKMHRDERVRFKAQLEEHINEGSDLAIDARFYNKEGELRWCRCRGSSSRNLEGKAERIVGIFFDITDRVKVEEEASNAILATEDKERSRIARDIHDSLQQTMSTALLNFEKVRSSLIIQDKLLAEKFQTGYSYLKQAITESRSLAHKLIPKEMATEGLSKAIEAMVEALNGSSSTKLVYYTNLKEERIKLAAEMTFYRITQEAINNVIKHAGASECTIQLMKHNNIVSLSIEDDGRGFNSDELKHSFGIHNMKNRAESVGAHLIIESAPKRGTQVIIELSQ